jgi:hypothetical protein
MLVVVEEACGKERREKLIWCPRLWRGYVLLSKRGRSRREEVGHPAMMRIASPMVGKILV